MILDALVLAAGRATRFGSQKLLAPFAGGVLLEAALGSAFAAPVREVLVVTGADGRAVEAAAWAHARGRGEERRLRFVRADRYMEGMSESLKAGVAALRADADGVFVYLGDMPRAPGAEAVRLAEALPGAEAACFMVGGERGHPVLLGRSLFAPIAELSGDVGAGRLLKSLGPRLARVPTKDRGALQDVDRPGDLDAAGSGAAS